MKLIQVLCVLIALPLIANCLPQNATARASSVTTKSIIQQHGYPFEEHTVQTSDGYILTMHRIPYSPKNGKPSKQLPVAFLQHGLLCSSSDWVLVGPKNALAFVLSDAGFDVWMGNARGNTYSKKHVTMHTINPQFWGFSWHEIAIYDIHAMIDKVLFWTGEDQVTYVGHSQGTTVFFVQNAMNSKFKSRIRSAHLLAPVAWMDHMESPLAKVFGPLMGQPNLMAEYFGGFEFLPNTKAMEMLGLLMCRDQAVTQSLCNNCLFLIGGWDSPHLNTTAEPLIMATTPAGASNNQLHHYLQEHESKYFRCFDYGKTANKKHYNNKTPPNYDVSKMDVAIHLYYSDNDYFAAIVDVHKLIYTAGDAIKGSYRLPHTKWNHLDFLWANDVKKILYDKVMEDIMKYFKKS